MGQAGSLNMTKTLVDEELALPCGLIRNHPVINVLIIIMLLKMTFLFYIQKYTLEEFLLFKFYVASFHFLQVWAIA